MLQSYRGEEPSGDGGNKNKYSLLTSQIMNQKDGLIKNLLNHGRIPNEGLNEVTIMSILYQISLQNLCNSEKNVKIGERESRIYSSIVRNKYFGFGHGIGRSGNLEDVQPKSAGNSLLCKMTTNMVKYLIKSFGIKKCEDVYILPYATGMCISTCLLYLKGMRKDSEWVIISRIDHKTCYKCLDFCNLKYIVVDMIFINDELQTDEKKIENLMKKLNEKICCIITVTSSYAPRNSDNILKISQLCNKYDIPHVINNGFGLQCTYICKEIQKCYESKGRIDFVVQSCDKNFLLPINGGIVFSSNAKMMKELKKTYPGRTPVNVYLDLFITLLELGKNKIMSLREKRVEHFNWINDQVQKICLKYNLKLIKTNKNKISIAINLNHLYNYCGYTNPKIINMLGSFLFYRNVTGHRVICSPTLIRQNILKQIEKQEMEKRQNTECQEVNENAQTSGSANMGDTTKWDEEMIDGDVPGDDDLKLDEEVVRVNKLIGFENLKRMYYKLNAKNKIVIGNKIFHDFGSSCSNYPYSYIAFSCVIGIEKEELQKFVTKLDESIAHFIDTFKRKNNSILKEELANPTTSAVQHLEIGN
ncbi:O-phosphoseryl-tRNA(Sec) selenium transferase, putative [Plasmodium chabaudi adami]|uniref:O-phosphoseryl-tRNA(Sec) selenium transferase n=1 Tax=Plasmodium chabaudi adami TaxID=5826 RepID=A0A1C6Y7V4_PLACE|nr:O-phosphoseryl-tRNA(Sec) selenium transferase, putative [Plasmodium chabaudi adami]